MALNGTTRVLLSAFVLAACASAAPIQYALTGTATGTLGGAPFSSAAFTVTSAADTSQVFVASGSPPFQTFVVIASNSTIDITGVGTLSFADQTYWDDPNGSGDIIFGDFALNNNFSLGKGILGFTRLFVGLESYDLKSSFGPVSGSLDFESSVFNNFTDVPTNLGALSLVSTNDTFSATTAPEPASFLLLVAGAAALRFRKRRAMARQTPKDLLFF